jgi:predicted nucleic-acid-binding Zn-ribbon protein
MPSTNQCIGSHYDELKQRVFYYNYNSSGYNGIYVYDMKTNAITPLLISYVDSGEDLFDFDPKYPVASINILYRTEEDGDILLWTDRKNRPMKLNIKEALISGKTYGTAWKKKYLTVARQMPLTSPTCSYGSDNNTNSNNLKNKLYQFRYRWIYKDNTKSTWGPWSKMFAPVNADTLATASDPKVDNYISVALNTGDVDCAKIEIGARHHIADTFTDSMLVATLDKTALTISNNTIYTYNFYNDSSYAFVDKAEEGLLFDYCPKTANTQELLNGNIIAYAGIKEGNTFSETFNVTAALTTIANSTAQGLTITQTNSDYYYSSCANRRNAILFTFSGGTSGLVNVTLNAQYIYPLPTPPGGYQTINRSGIYTYASGDTLATIVSYMNTYFNQTGTGFVATAGDACNSVPANSILIAPSQGGSELSITGSNNFTTSSAGVTDVNNSTYKSGSRYGFGIVYFDEFGVTNGVVTSQAMNIIAPEGDTSTLGLANISIPKITFSVNHKPPSWAKYFSFVRTSNLTVSNLVSTFTDNTIKGTSAGAGYVYFNIDSYQKNTNGYPIYEFVKGDRVRIMGIKNSASSSAIIREYPILDLIEADSTTPWVTTGSSLKSFIKVAYDSVVMSSYGNAGYTEFYLELYSPATYQNSDVKIYYEFGESYPVITDINGSIAHQGQTQSQVYGTTPAVFAFARGDFYQRTRINPANAVQAMYIIDKSVSDKYESNVVGNGRAFVIDAYAKETYYPTVIRYSLQYEQNTNINNTNRFFPANLDEYDRQRGDIQRLTIRGSQLRVFQNRGVGAVPVYQNVMQTADGNNIVTQNLSIINKIQYYQGEFGLGDQYCSLASSASADYFTDPIIGAQIRLSADGMTSLTETYKAHYYFNDKLTKYQKTTAGGAPLPDKFANGGYAKILGVYDVFEEQFTTCLQGSADGTNPITEMTFAFSEARNCYVSFYDFYPEWICNAGNLIITWVSGELWAHNNTTTYANFYGTQYSPSIKLVFNDHQNIKKHYNTITTLGNTTWVAPAVGDINTNLKDPYTGLYQQSQLIQGDFKIKDDKYHASLRRDYNSKGGLINGVPLKGTWVELNLQPVNPQSLVDLYYVDLSILEPINNR